MKWWESNWNYDWFDDEKDCWVFILDETLYFIIFEGILNESYWDDSHDDLLFLRGVTLLSGLLISTPTGGELTLSLGTFEALVSFYLVIMFTKFSRSCLAYSIVELLSVNITMSLLDFFGDLLLY